MARPGHGRSFHELPLVLFSALATAGGGVGAGHLLLGLLGRGWALPHPQALALSCLLLVGALVSAGHLGRPLRGPLALLGLGRSPLSNEIGVLGLALVLGVSNLLLAAGPWVSPLGFMTSLASAMLLLALGGVYVLPGQVAWRGLAAVSPLVMGLAWGLLFDGALNRGAPEAVAWIPLWLVLALDGAVSLGRWLTLERTALQYEVTHPPLFRRRRAFLILRLLLSPLGVSSALLTGGWEVAVLLFSLVLLLDRFAFYGLALRQTTESEVRRVEALLSGQP